MSLMPKIKRCPCCNSLNLFKTNGLICKNEFKNLIEWTLKKKVICRKCRVEFGLFINNKDTVEKIVWMDMIKCENAYLSKLSKLQKKKEKYSEENKEKKYLETLKEIERIQNQIRLDQIKIKVKVKVENRGMPI
jgi:hypothetical protein